MRPIAPFAVLAALLAAGVLSGCSSTPPYACGGECVPTVEGATGKGYGDYQVARRAFSRSDKDGSFIAVMEDVAWLRFEGEEQAVLEKHRAYFEQGYTTFEITLLTKDFTQPTHETFVLTDSKGARLVGKPVGYQSGMGQENERFAARFQVSFRHAVTREVGWVKLTRVADGAELEWRFPWAASAAPAGATAADAPATGATGSDSVRPTLPGERPTNLMQPRNPAPEPIAQGNGRPANLLTQPTAERQAPAPAYVAPAQIPATAAVGEPAWSQPPAAATFTPVGPAAGSLPAPAAEPSPAPPPPVLDQPPSGSPIRPGYLPPPMVRGR